MGLIDTVTGLISNIGDTLTDLITGLWSAVSGSVGGTGDGAA